MQRDACTLFLALCASRREIGAVNRRQASIIVILLWAAIFLPGLGSTEIKLEEGRRILPAITMLDTGKWAVPYVGGKAYLHKPPLMNWAIAGSFSALGRRDEWAARLPSVVGMLALALTAVALSGRSPGFRVETGLIAAIFMLAQLSSIDKGRLAEIDALYAAVSGIGILIWITWWNEDKSPWLLWPVPLALFGLAMLAKGPVHLVYFYVIVAVVAWHGKDSRSQTLRRLLHPAHIAGLLLMALIFLLWFLPYRHDEATIGAAQKWQEQSVGRITSHFDFAGWLGSIPRALCDHLPWILLAPILWRRDLDAMGRRNADLFRGVRCAVVVSFFVTLVIPGALPRYTMPLLAPFSLLLAIALSDSRLAPASAFLRPWWRANCGIALLLLACAIAAPAALVVNQREAILNIRGDSLLSYDKLLIWPLVSSSAACALCIAVFCARAKLARPELLAIGSGMLVAAAMFVFTGSAVPWLNRSESLRPAAEAMNALIPETQRLLVVDPAYQPLLFYVRRQYDFVLPLQRENGTYFSSDQFPASIHWVLSPEKDSARVQRILPEISVVRAFQTKNFPGLVLMRR